MAWTAPKVWTSGAVTAAEMNETSDDLTWLKAALTTHGVTSDSGGGSLITDNWASGISGAHGVASGSDTLLTTGYGVDFSAGPAGASGSGFIKAIEAGLWVAIGWVQFEADSTGWRQAWFEHDSTAYGKTSIPSAGGSAQTSYTFTDVIEVAQNENVYIYARQNSGSTLTTNYRLRLHRMSS